MATGSDWLLLLVVWTVVAVLLVTAYSVTAVAIRRYRRSYSLLTQCTCGHILYDHSRHSGRCQIKADPPQRDFNCVCMMFTPAEHRARRV